MVSRKLLVAAVLILGVVVYWKWGSENEWTPEDYRRRDGALRVFSPGELKQYDGRDPSLPLLLVVMGEVFNVSAGEHFYRKGKNYHIFVGQDASASFQTGDWKNAVADVRPLGFSALYVLTWRRFYRLAKERYPFVGVLDDLYYNAQGNPTAALKEVEQRPYLEDLALDKAKWEKEHPPCNVDFATVKCPRDSAGKPTFVRGVETFLGGKLSTKCFCFSRDALSRGVGPSMALTSYGLCRSLHKSVCEFTGTFSFH